MPPEDRIELFHQWATKYFDHGLPIAAETLVYRASPDSPSTLSNMSPAERAESTSDALGMPGGTDTLASKLCIATGMYQLLRTAAFYPDDKDVSSWREVEARVVWCDKSVWMTPWSARGVQEEIEESRRLRRSMRTVSLVCIKGANHFVRPLASSD